MPDNDDLVDLGGLVVPMRRLAPDAVGIADEGLQEAVDRARDEPGEPMPLSGWRLLRDDGDTVVVGAYDDSVWRGWCTITMSRENGRWQAIRSALGQDPRPTTTARGQGCSLTFSQPRFACRRGDLPQVTVTLTNASPNRVQDTTSWCALGHLLDVGTGQPLPSEPVFITAMGLSLDLGPGETTELPVVLSTRSVETLESGEYLIEATLADLDLRASDGRLLIE